MFQIDMAKHQALLERVMNNKMIEENEVDGIMGDEKAIKSLCANVFGDGSVKPSVALVHDFNNIVVKIADKEAKPQIKQILDFIAQFSQKPKNTIATQYTIPQDSKARLVWSATGSGVDVKRVAGGQKMFLTIDEWRTGYYYEPLTKAESVVEDFRKVITDLIDAKIRLYFDKMNEVIEASLTTAKIPANNQLVGDNLTLAGYNKLASRISRRGGQPQFLADTLMIDYFAQQQATGTDVALLTDTLRTELREALVPTKIGRTVAMNLVNPFTDKAGTKTAFPVNVGYMIGRNATSKPFIIDEIGGMTQVTEQNSQDGRIKMMIGQEVGMELIYGENLGYVKENAAVAL